MNKTTFRNAPAQLVKYLLSRLHLLFYSLMLVGLIEFLDRGSATQTVSWVREHPQPFFLNYLLVLSLVLIFSAIIGRIRISFWLVTLVLLVLGVVSGIKFRILGVPLLPWDIVLSSETADVAQYLNGLVSWKLIAAVAAFIIMGIVFLYKIPFFHAKYRWPEKIGFLIVAALLLTSIYSDKPAPLKRMANIATIPWDQADNYLQNGFLLCSMLNADLVIIKKPPTYSPERIQAIMDETPKRTSSGSPVKPNVIVMLSEAFWDPTIIPGITFNEDPVPTLHAMQKQFPSGTLLSPQFGGGTANVEFEVLSGNSMRFLPQGSLAYIQYVNHGIDSLASILTRQGYTATAVNPFHNWFFNSKNVYQNFGFSRFISSEFFEPVYRGPFIADSEVANTIIQESEKSQGPDMIFANTMENHAPFVSWKFADKHFTVSGDISAESKENLEALAEGIHDADKSLQMMIDHFTQTKEPTIIVFFGDHLPFMGNDYSVYRDTKYLKDNDPDFLKKMYSTPLLIWDNYLPPHKEALNMSPSFVSPYVLNMANLQGTYFTDFLYNFYKKSPVLPPRNLYESMMIDENSTLKYADLQYDNMFGDRIGYSKIGIKDTIVNPGYELGYGKMVIGETEPKQVVSGEVFNPVDGDSTITVNGTHLVPGAVLYLNGKQLSTKPGTVKGTLTAKVPKDLYSKPGPLHIQAKVTDSKNIVVSQSNVVDLQAAGK